MDCLEVSEIFVESALHVALLLLAHWRPSLKSNSLLDEVLLACVGNK